MQYLCNHFMLGETCLYCSFGELHDHVFIVKSPYRCHAYHITCKCIQSSKLEYEMKYIIKKGKQK